MKFETLILLFADHPDIPGQLLNYPAIDPLLGNKRGFHKFHSGKMILLRAVETNDMSFLKTYMTAIIEVKTQGNFSHKCVGLLAALRKAKKAIYERDDIGNLKEFKDLPADEKAKKVASAMIQIDLIFKETIPPDLQGELDRFKSSHNNEEYKAKLQKLLAEAASRSDSTTPASSSNT